jgi:hypothetical protein
MNEMFPLCAHYQVMLPVYVGMEFNLNHVMGFGGNDFGIMEVDVMFLLKLCSTASDLSSCPKTVGSLVFFLPGLNRPASLCSVYLITFLGKAVHTF